VVEKDRIVDYQLRVPEQKQRAVAAFKLLNYHIIAGGDSFNDTAMLTEAHVGILFRAPENVKQQFPQFKAVEAYADPFAVAALHVMTTLSGSLLLTLMTAEGALSPRAAWRAAHVDQDFQISRWGEDDEARRCHAARWRDFEAAAKTLQEYLLKHLEQILALPAEDRLKQRYAKFRAFGRFSEKLPAAAETAGG